MITTLAMTGVLTGAILGLRFKVAILIPAFLISSAVIFDVDLALGKIPLSTLLVAFLETTMLQLGYLSGALVTKTRTRKDASDIIAMSQSR